MNVTIKLDIVAGFVTCLRYVFPNVAVKRLARNLLNEVIQLRTIANNSI